MKYTKIGWGLKILPVLWSSSQKGYIYMGHISIYRVFENSWKFPNLLKNFWWHNPIMLGLVAWGNFSRVAKKTMCVCLHFLFVNKKEHVVFVFLLCFSGKINTFQWLTNAKKVWITICKIARIPLLFFEQILFWISYCCREAFATTIFFWLRLTSPITEMAKTLWISYKTRPSSWNCLNNIANKQ